MSGGREPGAGWVLLAVLLAGGAAVVGVGGPWGGGLRPGTAWSNLLDWRPGLAGTEPWRWWTAAWVHWSDAHLGVNLLGAAVVGAVGWRARSPATAALAWFLAWPLTHALMDVPPAARVGQTLQHYGGLSGVLHAGVVVLGLTLALPGAMRWRPAGWRAPERPGRAPDRVDPSFTEVPPAMTGLEAPIELDRFADDLADDLADAPTASRPPVAPLTAGQATRHRLIGVALVGGTLAKVLLEAPWDLALRPNALLGIEVAPVAHACGVAAGAIAWLAVAALAGLWKTGHALAVNR